MLPFTSPKNLWYLARYTLSTKDQQHENKNVGHWGFSRLANPYGLQHKDVIFDVNVVLAILLHGDLITMSLIFRNAQISSKVSVIPRDSGIFHYLYLYLYLVIDIFTVCICIWPAKVLSDLEFHTTGTRTMQALESGGIEIEPIVYIQKWTMTS